MSDDKAEVIYTTVILFSGGQHISVKMTDQASAKLLEQWAGGEILSEGIVYERGRFAFRVSEVCGMYRFPYKPSTQDRMAAAMEKIAAEEKDEWESGDKE